MDKKNTTIGVLLLIAALATLFFGNALNPRRPAPAQPQTVEAPSTQPGPATAAPAATGAPSATAPAAAPLGPQGLYVFPITAQEPAVAVLENEFVAVTFTDRGGAIREVAFKKYPDAKGNDAPYVFNRVHAAPILAFMNQPGLDAAAQWQVVEKSAARIVFRAVGDGRLEVTRTFALQGAGEPGDPYRIQVSTSLKNLGADPLPAQRVSFNLGTATLVGAHDSGLYLNASIWDDDDLNFLERADTEGGGFFKRIFGGDTSPKPFVERPGRLVWGALSNQFFATVFTPAQPGTGIVVRRVKLRPEMLDTQPAAFGLTADARVDLPRLEAGATSSLDAALYIGPKEYERLKKFGHREEKVMQFTRFLFNKYFGAGFFAPLLLTFLTWFHSFIPNWGWAIITTTLLLKSATLPLTLSAAKSAKRMAKIQPRLKEINEKYADNPQRKQKETLELFKEAKVNPLGGCLPILITMPFFIGFFAMLQTSSELRFAEFFWIKDLSEPDTVAFLFGLPINVMPLLMGITSVVQMQLVPTPSVDNAQARMMKFMPLMFVLFCYNFGSGLALYWTVSNLFTIVQQLVINRMPDPAPAPVPAGGVRNVTPAGKKPKKK